MANQVPFPYQLPVLLHIICQLMIMIARVELGLWEDEELDHNEKRHIRQMSSTRCKPELLPVYGVQPIHWSIFHMVQYPLHRSRWDLAFDLWAKYGCPFFLLFPSAPVLSLFLPSFHTFLSFFSPFLFEMFPFGTSYQK